MSLRKEDITMENKTLHLVLKAKWFDMIASGVKKDEYREIKPFWIKRLLYSALYQNPYYNRIKIDSWFREVKPFGTVTFSRGYTSKTIVLEWKGMTVGPAKPEWSDNWQGDVFRIHLGEIIDKKL